MRYRSDNCDSITCIGISSKRAYPSYELGKALKSLRNDLEKAFRYADTNSNTVPGMTYMKKEKAYAAEQKRQKRMRDRQKRAGKSDGKYYNNLNSNETFGFEDLI